MRALVFATSVLQGSGTSFHLSPEATMGLERISSFNSEYNKCVHRSEIELFRPESPCVRPGQEITLLNGRSIHILPGIVGEGESGVSYSTSDPNLIVKVSNGAPLCREAAAMLVLDGLGGIVPRIYPLDTPLGDWCSVRVIVMDKVGDADYYDLVEVAPVAHKYMRFASVLSAVDRLHRSGFVHGDLHPQNVRVKLDDPQYVSLIDLGDISALPWTRYSNMPSRNDELEEEETALVDLIPDDSTLSRGFAYYLQTRDPDHWPNWNEWIKRYRDVAQMLISQSETLSVDLGFARDFIDAKNLPLLSDRKSPACEEIPESFTFDDGVKVFHGPVSSDGKYIIRAFEDNRHIETNIRRTRIAKFLLRKLSVKSVRVPHPSELPEECRRNIFFDKNYNIGLSEIYPQYLGGAMRLIVTMLKRLHMAGIFFNSNFRDTIFFDKKGLPSVAAIGLPERLTLYIDLENGKHISHPDISPKTDLIRLANEVVNLPHAPEELKRILVDLRDDLTHASPQSTPNYDEWTNALALV